MVNRKSILFTKNSFMECVLKVLMQYLSKYGNEAQVSAHTYCKVIYSMTHFGYMCQKFHRAKEFSRILERVLKGEGDEGMKMVAGLSVGDLCMLGQEIAEEVPAVVEEKKDVDEEGYSLSGTGRDDESKSASVSQRESEISKSQASKMSKVAKMPGIGLVDAKARVDG